jgi:hypothetical protein
VQTIEIVTLVATSVALGASGVAWYLLRQADRHREVVRVLARVLRSMDNRDREPLGAEARIEYFNLRDRHHERLRVLPLSPAEADELEVLRAGLRALGRRG